MKDLGSLQYFLGIDVAYSPRGYLLSQSKYIVDILERARFTDNKIVNTLIEVNVRYSSSECLPLTNPTLYCTILGAWYISSLLLQILHMLLFILLVILLILLLLFTRQLFFIFCDIFEVSFSRSFTFTQLFLGAACIL